MTRTGSSTGTRVLAAETTLTAVGNTTESGKIQLHEFSTNGNHKISISAPNSLIDHYSLTLPANDGNASQVLTTNGSGVLTWEDQTGGGGGSGDITSVVAGDGLTGSATSGDATLNIDISEFSDVTPADGDKLLTLDSDGSTEQLTTVASLATLFAGTNLTATNSVINVDDTLTNKTLGSNTTFSSNPVFKSAGSGNYILNHSINITADRTIALPELTDNDTFVFENHAQTLTNKTLISAVLNGTISGSAIKDEDDMSSNSTTAVASQQSIKAYVDTIKQGLHIKEACKVATTASGTLSSSFTKGIIIDGIKLSTGDRILIKDQINASENGIYDVNASGPPDRSSDMAADDTASGDFTFVTEGTVNGDHGFVCTSNSGSDTVGTNNLTFTQFSGAGQITAGDGLTKSGNTLSIDAKSNSGIVIDTTELSLDLSASSITGTLAVSDGGTGATSLNDLITLGDHTTGNYVATIADSGTGGITVANSGSESAAVTLEMDVNGLTTASIASGDFIPFSDESYTGDPSRKDTIDDVANLFAGNGLSASSAVLSVGAGTGIDVAADAISVDVSDFMTNGADNRIVTATGTDAMNAEENLTFNGSKCDLTGNLFIKGNQNVTPGDGSKIHIDASTITDTNTSTSGTTSLFSLVNIEAPTLESTNSNVITTDAATFYISGSVKPGTNNTITNRYTLWCARENNESLIRLDGTSYTRKLNITGATGVSSPDDIRSDTTITRASAGVIAVEGHNVVLVNNNLGVFAETTSAQLRGVISDESGSGSLVFANSPTLVAPALGTPASGVLTNCTGTASGLTAGKVTVTDSTTDTNFPIVFHNESNALLDDTGSFIYNPSSGTLSSSNSAVSDLSTINRVEYTKSNVMKYNQVYQGNASGSYFENNEYQKIITIIPSDNTQNYHIQCKISVHGAQHFHHVYINAGLRSNILPDLDWNIYYDEEYNDNRYIDPLLWTKETTTAGFILAFKALRTIYGNVTCDITVIPRYSDHKSNISINSTSSSEQSSIDSGYTSNDMTKVISKHGSDVNFSGNSSGAYMLWDQSDNNLIVKEGKILVKNSNGDSKFIANTNGNVTVSDLTVSGGDINYGNGQDATLSIASTTSTTAGRDLTISAGSTATGSANINGGDLHLKSGGGDGTGTSIMTFSTKVSGTDAADERMRIHTDGSIGIGTSSPTEKLEVYPDTDVSSIFGKAHIGYIGHSDFAGFSHVDMNSTSTFALMQNAGGFTILNAADTRYIDFRINNSRKMQLNADGDLEFTKDSSIIKFGVDNEITLTHVHDTGLTLTNTISDTDNRPIILKLKSEEDAIIADDVIGSIEFAAGDSDGTDGATVAAGIHAIAENTFAASTNPTKLVFTTGVSETAAASATAKMTLSSTGALTVADEITASGLTISKNTSGNDVKEALKLKGMNSSGDGDNGIGVSIVFGWENEDGNPYIPSSKIYSVATNTDESNETSDLYLQTSETGTLQTYIILDASAKQVKINCLNGLTVHGDITALTSDKRLKTNIEIIEDPLEKINKLSGFTYDWSKEKCEMAGFKPSDERQVGVFAQDIQAVLPEAVKPAPFDNEDGKSKSGENYLTVQYEKIVPLLIESIKEQQKMIENLQGQIDELK